MEKVNEIGRFKQRSLNGIEFFDDWLDLDLDLNLESLHSYRFDYTIHREDLSMFLDYVGYLTIHELGIEDCKVRVTRDIRNGSYNKYCNVYLTLKGQKNLVDNVTVLLKQLWVGLNEAKEN